MSVPVSKRSISEYAFYSNAVAIREELTVWILRDFGVKDRFRELSLAAKKVRMSEDDRRALAEILDRNNMSDKICESYPDWWVAMRRASLDSLAQELVLNVSEAYEIYATCLAEWEYRRVLQDKAIACVHRLLEELQFTLRILYKTGGVDVNRHMKLVKLCSDEIALLKGWRKQGNEIKNRLLRQDVARRAKIAAKIVPDVEIREAVI